LDSINRILLFFYVFIQSFAEALGKTNLNSHFWTYLSAVFLPVFPFSGRPAKISCQIALKFGILGQNLTIFTSFDGKKEEIGIYLSPIGRYLLPIGRYLLPIGTYLLPIGRYLFANWYIPFVNW
jgi:hypothetical protein